MATRNYSVDQVMEFGAASWIITWTGLLNGDDGQPIQMPECADGSIQFYGTFGAGGTIIWEGTNDRSSTANFIILTDPQGTTISKTAAAIETCEESAFRRRPRVTAGDGTTALTAVALLRRGY